MKLPLCKNSNKVLEFIKSHKDDEFNTFSFKFNKGWYDIRQIEQPVLIDDSGSQYIFSKGKSDNIINRLVNKRFGHNVWITKDRVIQCGYKIKKGQKPLKQRLRIGSRETTEYKLYNIDQTTFDPPKIRNYNHSNHNEAIDRWIDSIGVNIAYNGFSPQFWGENDTIVFPHWEQFKNDRQFYSTIFHEIGHWTGWKKRLERSSLIDQIDNNDPVYGVEEAIAELVAIKLCEYWNVPVDINQHIMYITGWLDFLDPKDKIPMYNYCNHMADKAIQYLFKLTGKLND